MQKVLACTCRLGDKILTLLRGLPVPAYKKTENRVQLKRETQMNKTTLTAIAAAVIVAIAGVSYFSSSNQPAQDANGMAPAAGEQAAAMGDAAADAAAEAAANVEQAADTAAEATTEAAADAAEATAEAVEGAADAVSDAAADAADTAAETTEAPAAEEAAH